ncbi:MAG TPA: prenyltransferase/squalene oxidase repeat-containing protein [Bacteroidales bacterium]|nr:prenyltransferase/squalene oxidase repeat-containing protein [Bacteroidales bacterium]HPS61451.1 prenyltransferase/squalene oxidase repeat-containing protein [Bacteroidales bacterium]
MLQNEFDRWSESLRASLTDRGCWEGELSSSALATAVAVVALKLDTPDPTDERVRQGIHWLCSTINPDGGFGDSPGSLSNVSTTLLAYAAIHYCPPETTGAAGILRRMEQYLIGQGIDVRSAAIVDSILGYYGKDLTFSVPILSMLVICNILDRKALKKIPSLPYELTLLPLPLYRFFNLQVVSYALPALIAVGIFLFRHKPLPNPVVAFLRRKATRPALRKLQRMIPSSGGFLEAIPLTAFVSICLIRAGFADHPAVTKGVAFLSELQRSDGSWPIDTNLSTWVTTLSIKALGPRIRTLLTEKERDRVRQFLLDHQYQRPHSFNQAAPGGWGWTSLSGAVPDADDTAGAILALLTLDPEDPSVRKAALEGCRWLAGLQNRDGGIPTFCRGWGRLPFDASCCDLTGHTVLAWIRTTANMSKPNDGQPPVRVIPALEDHINHALRFLAKIQRNDGSWLPLWFGSQLSPDKTNPVFGTARVASYLDDALEYCIPGTGRYEQILQLMEKARAYLASCQNEDGSWGSRKGIPGTIEETAAAVSAQVRHEPVQCRKAFDWLQRQTGSAGLKPSPIGLYFATLWYDEKMYPYVFYLEALRKAIEGFPQPGNSAATAFRQEL